MYRNAGTPLVKENDEISGGWVLFSVDDNHAVGYQIEQDGAYVDPVKVMDING